MKRSILLASITVILTSFPNLRANLVFNGDFEMGNTGFSTGYVYTDAKPGGLFWEGRYAVDKDPSEYHMDAISYGDHTSGAGNMMVVNGATTPGVSVWEQVVSVSPTTLYEFSFWLSNWAPASHNLANLECFINGVSIGSCSTPETGAVWAEFSATWQSGLSTTAAIKIIDVQTAISTNDFAIDDISMTAVPQPAMVDIKPDTLDLKSTGKWITCYIELGEEHDVGDIDVSTAMLNEQVPAELRPTQIADYDEDGIADLMVKFDRSAVQEILATGDAVEVTVTGQLTDGTSFEGTDVIRVISPGGQGQ